MKPMKSPGSATEKLILKNTSTYTVNTPQKQVRQNRRDLIELPLSTIATSSDKSFPVKETSMSNSDITLHRSTRVNYPPSKLISDPNWKYTQTHKRGDVSICMLY